LCFALELEEQKRSGFRYQYSNYQVEYSRNLIFEIGGHMDQVFQALIDRSRVPLDLETIKTVLGYQRRPRYRQLKSRSAQWAVTRRAESQTARSELRNHSYGHASRLPGTGADSLNIDNNFFKLRH
jgi:hypothetical protein